MRNSTLLGAAVVALLVALTASLYAGKETGSRPSAPAVPAEGIARLFATHLNDSNGQEQSLAQWRGKTLVINFWAAWCPPCREEMPYFSRLQLENAAKNIQFVGIAIDSADNVRAFSSTQPTAYPLLVAEAEGPELARQLGNSQLALPYTVVLADTGQVLLARLGRVGEKELDALLQRATAGK